MTWSRRTVYLNGKWLSHPITGTERYATEIAKEWASSHPDLVTLLVPADADVPDWAESFHIRRSRFRGTVFEQLALPVMTFGREVISMAGPAPLLKRRQLAVLHDASVFDVPHSYSRVFGTWYRLLYLVLGRSAKSLVTVSAFSAERLSSRLRVPAARFTVAPGAWQHLSRRPADAEQQKSDRSAPFALFLGTPAPHKNVGATVAAFVNAGIECVVVGGMRRDVFGTADTDQPTAQYVGRISDDEVAALMRRATALVFPSTYEGFGLPLLEAQSQGCAVISSNAAALPEVAGDGAAYFDPRRPEDAVARFQELRSAERRRELVERGFANLVRFSWAASARALADRSGIADPVRS